MLRLLCQAREVGREDVAKFVLGDYSAVPKVTLASLKRDLEAMELMPD